MLLILHLARPLFLWHNWRNRRYLKSSSRRTVRRLLLQSLQPSRDHVREIGLAAWAKVDVEDQVHSGIRAPSHAVGLNYRLTAGLPGKEMSIGIEGLFFDVQVHAWEAGTWDLFLTARGARTVEYDVGMMKDLGASGADLDRLNPASGRNGDRQNKIPEDFAAIGGKLEGLRDAKDQVGRA